MNILLVRAKPTFMDMILGIPIGLAMIGAVVDRLKQHHVEILDLALERSTEAAEQKLRDKMAGGRRYDLVGLTCMTVEYEPACRAAQLIKAIDPSVRTVFGGQHPTIRTEEVIKNDFCDFVVIGEGEETFLDLVVALERGGNFTSVFGLAFTANGQAQINPPRPSIMDLDALPFPAYHLLDVEAYFRLEAARYTPKNKRCLQIFTSRGCPWRCTYCHDLFGKKFRARTAENVLEEIRLLYHQYGIRELMVEDDIFNLDMERAKKICDLIIASEMKLYLQFGNGLRLERFDEELVRKLAQAGTHHIAIAIESASPRIQKLIKKNLRLDKTMEVFSWLRKHKINSLGFFMIGFPFETKEEIEQTIQYARQTDLDEALFSIVVPYSGTELNQYVQEQGLFDPDSASRGGGSIALIKSPNFDFSTLKKLQRKAYFTFFSSKFRFIRMLPKLFNIHSAWKYLRAIERNFLAYGGDASSRIN
ncbi:MAG: radical SAM protein [Acidobacteria bacterium]|nr:radical SAM protein [Acidobacteriota bacterium]MBI3656780.1 radical SAM protein [Acidobacteriota bacterium]